jgi:diaminopimelate decarboxylase
METKKIYERPLIKPLNKGLMNKFGTRVDYSAFSEIDNVAVAELLEKYGSPLFIYSENTIRQNFNDAKRAFETRYPKVQFAWSYKTCYLNAICDVYHSEGSWAEVVSRFEYDKAIANGVNPENIIFNGPDKTDDDLQVAAKLGSLIHIDHFDELYRLHDIANELKIKPRVAIRVNMDTGIYPMWDRFGFNYENGQAWEAITKIVVNGKLDLVGLHTHIGTYVMTANAYAVAATKMADLAINIRQRFQKTISYIDMGGGFASQNTLKGAFYPGSDTNPEIAEYAEAITTALLKAGFSPQELPYLYLETGRALIDNAGFLAGTVIANKRLSDGRSATIVDFGINSLFTSMWYDHRVTIVEESGMHSEETVIYGPLCMNIDVIRESITLPPLRPGNHLVVHHVGAYNVTQSMQFITFRPAVVLIDNQRNAHVIRKRESMDVVQSHEVLPDYLKLK